MAFNCFLNLNRNLVPIRFSIRTRRRTLNDPPWIPPKMKKEVKLLSVEHREKIEEALKGSEEKIKLWAPQKTGIDLTVLPTVEREWTPQSHRFGLIARKIGMMPQWLNDGTRVLCTLLEVPESHIISVVDPDTWFKTTSVGKRKAFTRFGPMWKVTVGAINTSPLFLSDSYRLIFEKAGVAPKDRLASFMTTEDAIMPPGTLLDVRHFTVGQFVNISGKTIDWGFQGGVHRWGMRGQPALNTTKSHRRIGSVGSTGDARVWPGKKMPGHMGYQWTMTTGLQILRLNPRNQVLYVKGCVPGDVGEIMLIKDCYNEKKTVQNPPFPTFISNEEDVKPIRDVNDIADITSDDIFSPNLFRFSSPSVVFTEKHETPSAARDKSRAKIAKVKK